MNIVLIVGLNANKVIVGLIAIANEVNKIVQKMVLSWSKLTLDYTKQKLKVLAHLKWSKIEQKVSKCSIT